MNDTLIKSVSQHVGYQGPVTEERYFDSIPVPTSPLPPIVGLGPDYCRLIIGYLGSDWLNFCIAIAPLIRLYKKPHVILHDLDPQVPKGGNCSETLGHLYDSALQNLRALPYSEQLDQKEAIVLAYHEGKGDRLTYQRTQAQQRLRAASVWAHQPHNRHGLTVLAGGIFAGALLVLWIGYRVEARWAQRIVHAVTLPFWGPPYLLIKATNWLPIWAQIPICIGGVGLLLWASLTTRPGQFIWECLRRLTPNAMVDNYQDAQHVADRAIILAHNGISWWTDTQLNSELQGARAVWVQKVEATLFPKSSGASDETASQFDG